MKKILALLLSACLMVSLLAGCNSGSQGNQQGADAGKRDDLIVIIPNDFTTLDPYKTPSYAEINFVANIYDPLLFTNTEGTTPMLAESWDASADGLQYTFHLKKGVKFQNGDELKASDVVYSVKRYMEESWMTVYSFMIAGAKAVDDYTVQINLKYAYGSFLSSLNYLLISNEKYMTEQGDNAAKNPMGTGAYKFKAWNVAQSLEFEANEDYFLGAPSIKNLTLKIVTDPNTAYIAMQTGEADFYFNANPMDYNNAVSDGKLGTDDCVSNMYYFTAFNVDRLPQKVRQALCYCVDKNELNTLCFEGSGIPVDQALFKGQEGYVDDIKNYPQDIEKAKALMKEAGHENGMDLTFFYGETNLNQKLGEALQSMFAKINVNLVLKPVEVGTWWSLFGDGDYDISRGGYPMEDANTDISYHDMFSGKGGTFNVSRVNDDHLNELLENARVEQDGKVRNEIYKEITNYLNEQAYVLPNFYSRSALIYNPKLEGAYAINTQRYIYSKLSWK